MPILPENRALYPANWPAISAEIRYHRANNRCEGCGVTNHALGGRDPNGRFLEAHPTGQRGAGGFTWPEPGDMGWCGPDESKRLLRIIRIVLTVAHLDHDPRNCDPANLKAWCQRCHNRHDAAHRRETFRRRCAAGDLFA